MNTRTLTRTIALIAALASATQVRAQGDLDILLRSVPPVVMIQFDTSGSMSNIVLPTKYLDDRGAGSPIELVQHSDRRYRNAGAPRGAGEQPRCAEQLERGWHRRVQHQRCRQHRQSRTTERTCQIFSGRATSTRLALCTRIGQLSGRRCGRKLGARHRARAAVEPVAAEPGADGRADSLLEHARRVRWSLPRRRTCRASTVLHDHRSKPPARRFVRHYLPVHAPALYDHHPPEPLVRRHHDSDDQPGQHDRLPRELRVVDAERDLPRQRSGPVHRAGPPDRREAGRHRRSSTR